MLKLRQTILALTVAGCCCNAVHAQETPEPHKALGLSNDTLALLQAEMRELAVASQAMVICYVSGEWGCMQRLGEQIRASYVMEQELTDAQKQELADKLPERFRHLDAELHARADRLASAAANEDPELVAFHFFRLLETCATCHSEHAASRFPGFASSATDIHQH
jgi:cytochrome c556